MGNSPFKKGFRDEKERKKTRSLRNDLGHLSGINHDISHREPSDEDGSGDDSREPGIMLSQFHLPDVVGNQFIDLESQRKKDPYAHHDGPEKKSEFTPHDQVDGLG